MEDLAEIENENKYINKYKIRCRSFSVYVQDTGEVREREANGTNNKYAGELLKAEVLVWW